MKPESEKLTVMKPEHQLFNASADAPAERSMIEQAVSRQAQEVKAAMVIAKQFPRDENAAYSRVMRSCSRKALAECAQYAYPRGGSTITGPSIRLAEVLAQNWGNVDFGIVELEQRLGQESIVMAYAWDLETNTRQTKVFTVPHIRSKRTGNEILTDPRDVYELVANQGARRLRACILGIIPGDVVDAALERCEKTLTEGEKKPLADRIREMVAAFQESHGVTTTMIEARLGHKLDAIIEQEMVTLRKIFTSLKDGAAKREDFFQVVSEPKFEGKKAETTTPSGTSEPPKETARTKKADKAKADEPPRATPREAVKNLMTASKVSEPSLLKYLKDNGGAEFAKFDDIDDDTLTQLKNIWGDAVENMDKDFI